MRNENMVEEENAEGTLEEEDIETSEVDEEELEEEETEEFEEDNEEDAEGTSEVEDELIAVTYKDASGKEVSEDLSYEEISEYIAFGKSVSKQDIQYAINAKPIIEKINMSPILQDFLYYKMNSNLSDEQILWGLHKQKFDKVKPEDETKEFKSIEEEIDYKVQQKLAQELKGTKETLQQMHYERDAEKAARNNDNLLNEALIKNGFNGKLDDKLSRSMVEALRTVVRTSDYNTYKLDKDQADAIVRIAMSSTKQPEKSSKMVITKNIQRQAKAPQILGNVNADKQKGKRVTTENTTITQRAENFKKMFG